MAGAIRTRRSPLLLAGLVLAGAPTAPAEAPEFSADERRVIARMSPLPPPPPNPTNRYADDPQAARLGQMLFFDPRLSANGAISCATCHDPAKSFTDGRAMAEGLATGTRNTPALWNVAYNRWHFWDGSADTLWAQALHPIERDDEMGSSRLEVAHLIDCDGDLRAAYQRVFGPLPDLADARRFPPRGKPARDPRLGGRSAAGAAERAWGAMIAADRDAIDRLFSNVGKALEAYERKLVSRAAPFDRFARGLAADDAERMSALSPAAQRGAKLFIGRGQCRLCHTGPNFTDGEFHNTRVPPAAGRAPTDPGRLAGLPAAQRDPFNSAGAYSDAPAGERAQMLGFVANGQDNGGAFKTPSLRNVAGTAPYMHEGQLQTLEEVLRYYSTLADALPAHHGGESVLAPRDFSPAELADLAAFLTSLTDESLNPALLRPP